MMPDLAVRVMAFIGSIAAGAFLLGWLAQLLAKLSFNQKVPPWPLWGVRLLGGIVAGLFAWMWLFGGGGGLGGPGGFSLFGGAGRQSGKEAHTKKDESRDKEKEKSGKAGEGKNKDEKNGKVAPPPGGTLRVEVLGDDTLRKIGRGSLDAGKRYRIPGEMELRTLDEVQKLILKRRMKPGLVRLEIVVYLDSPARDRPQVAALADWARDLNGEGDKLKVDFYEPDRPAPIE